MEYLASSIFPTGSLLTVTSGIRNVISGNIWVIVAVLGVLVGLKVIFDLLIIDFDSFMWRYFGEGRRGKL